MMIKATIELPEESHAIFQIEREHSFGAAGHTARSYCLVCPSCLSIWAKFRMEGDPFCWPVAQFCRRCPVFADGLRPVPGSLLIQHGLDTIDDSLLLALPEELLIREFTLHLEALDNGNLELRDFSSRRT
jgi:hypothetical protein